MHESFSSLVCHNFNTILYPECYFTRMKEEEEEENIKSPYVDHYYRSNSCTATHDITIKYAERSQEHLLFPLHVLFKSQTINMECLRIKLTKEAGENGHC